MSKLSAEELASAEAWLRTRSVAINDELVGKLFAHIAALERELGEARTRRDIAIGYCADWDALRSEFAAARQTLLRLEDSLRHDDWNASADYVRHHIDAIDARLSPSPELAGDALGEKP